MSEHLTPSISTPQRLQDEFKALLILGIPMGFTQLAQFSAQIIDTIMIGRIGGQALAAVALGSVIYFTLWMIGFGPVMATSPLIAQTLGANRNARHDVRISVRMALWIIVIMSPFTLGVICLSEPLFISLKQDATVAKMAGEYALTLSVGWPLGLASFVLRNFLAAIGKTLIPFFIILITTGLNIFLNYLFIFGNWGFPEWHHIGAAFASVLSYCISFILFIVYIQLEPLARRFHIFKRFWHAHWSRFRTLFHLGWPISVATLFEGMLFYVAILIVGQISVEAQAAFQIGLNVATAVFMLSFGLSMAGAIRVGLAAGRNDIRAIKDAGLVTIFTSMAIMAIFASIIAMFPHNIATLYLNMEHASNASLATLVALFLPIAAAFMLFDGVQVAANQCLRGLKDVHVSMLLAGFSYWVIGFPLAVYLGLYTSLQAQGVWYGLMAGLVVAAILLGARFYQLVWHKAS